MFGLLQAIGTVLEIKAKFHCLLQKQNKTEI